jgi:hypothetical protein
VARRKDWPTEFVKFQLNGKNYVLSQEDVGAKMSYVVPRTTDKYFILINNRPYPPKQVLEMTLGVPAATFTTAAANAILRRLGYDIQIAGQAVTAIRTESERLFEAYLEANGYLNFQFEPEFSNATSRPDFKLDVVQGARTLSVLFEVKEFQATPADFHLGGGSYDPYAAIREKIRAGKKKFQEYKQYPCALVLYNTGKPLVDLRWEFIYGAMLGNLGYSFPFDPILGQLVDEPTLTPIFAGGGQMQPDRNTTISAIIVLELLSTGKRRLEIEAAKTAKTIGRDLNYEEFFRLIDSSKGTERDISLRQLRTVTCLNPYRNQSVAFPDKLFRGPYDEHYGEVLGNLQRTYLGEELRKIEAAEKDAGVKQHLMLPRGTQV